MSIIIDAIMIDKSQQHAGSSRGRTRYTMIFGSI